MNQGHWIFVLLRFTAAVAMHSGTIHSARANLTVVAITVAASPYLCAAPTTELVSWIASAAHNPNCGCERCSDIPIRGKISSAIEFRIKTVPSETDISSSFAPTMGPTAAMALPPHIAVPVEIRNDATFSTFNIFPIAKPIARVAVIPIAVYKMPLRPARKTLFRFIPKPRSTTEACSRYFVKDFVSLRNGFKESSPSARPTASADGGDAKGLIAKISPKTKITFEIRGERSTLCFTRPGFYQTRQMSFFSFTIGEPALQLNASPNSGIFVSGAFVRYFGGECGSVTAITRSNSSRSFVHHCCALPINQRCSGVKPSIGSHVFFFFLPFPL